MKRVINRKKKDNHQNAKQFQCHTDVWDEIFEETQAIYVQERLTVGTDNAKLA